MNAMTTFEGELDTWSPRRTFARLPDPVEYALRLPVSAQQALLASYRRQEGYRTATRADAELLLPYGLCEARGPYLTNFGTAVRRALLDWMES